jgi:3-deoxy-7-phosphoheptulonate synthase
MTMTPLPSPHEIKSQLERSPQIAAFIANARNTAKNIIQGKDPRIALIVGPCSIHDRKSAVEYAERIKALSQKLSSTCFLVMRTYVEKPRTATGWKGLLYDPHLDSSNDIKTGILWTRQLLLTLAEMQVPCAAEFVDPLAALYFEDLVTWGFIGARTSASQPHRQFASGMQMPLGFKNSIDGNLICAINGVISAKSTHSSMHIDTHGKLCALQSDGNPFAHIVLRGACEFTNFDPASVHVAKQMLEKSHLPQRLMIDCSHGNCQKLSEKQPEAFNSVLEQIGRGNSGIFGLMLESHLKSGNQPLTEDPSILQYDVSITDPCLSWSATEELIYSADRVFSSTLAGVS